MFDNKLEETGKDKVYTGIAKKPIIAAVCLIVGLVIAVLIAYSMPKRIKTDKVLMTVGEEKIYQTDLLYEESVLPKSIDKKKLKSTIISKLINDSIIIQSGGKEGLITLDATFFNSPKKDYAKRFQHIKKVKDAVNAKADSISGEIITVWFYNNEPSEFGYEKGKEVAKGKIDDIYKLVTEKKLTLLQAKEKLLADPDIKKLDPSAYQSNVYIEFKDIQSGQKITADKTFDTMLHSTKLNEFTPIVGIKGKTRGVTEEAIDLLYAFGYIYSRRDTSDGASFDKWLESSKSKYPVVEQN